LEKCEHEANQKTRGRWNGGVVWEKQVLESIFRIKNSVHKKQHTKMTRTEESIEEK